MTDTHVPPNKEITRTRALTVGGATIAGTNGVYSFIEWINGPVLHYFFPTFPEVPGAINVFVTSLIVGPIAGMCVYLIKKKVPDLADEFGG